MNIFIRMGQALSAWLFKVIVLANTEEITSIEEYNQLLKSLRLASEMGEQKQQHYKELRECVEKLEQMNQRLDELEETQQPNQNEWKKTARIMLEEINKINGKVEKLTSDSREHKEIAALQRQLDEKDQEIESLKQQLEKVKEQINNHIDNHPGSPIPTPPPLPPKVLPGIFLVKGNENRVAAQESQDSVKAFADRVMNTADMHNFLKRNEKVGSFSTYLKNLEKFELDVQKKWDTLSRKLESLEEKECLSVQVVEAMFKIIDRDLLQKWMPAIYRVLEEESSDNKNASYIEFLKTVNAYLDSVGLYTYSEMEEGNIITEKDNAYYEAVPVIGADSTISNHVCRILLYPYQINFVENGQVVSTYTMGKAEIYQSEE